MATSLMNSHASLLHLFSLLSLQTERKTGFETSSPPPSTEAGVLAKLSRLRYS